MSSSKKKRALPRLVVSIKSTSIASFQFQTNHNSCNFMFKSISHGSRMVWLRSRLLHSVSMCYYNCVRIASICCCFFLLLRFVSFSFCWNSIRLAHTQLPVHFNVILTKTHSGNICDPTLIASSM